MTFLSSTRAAVAATLLAAGCAAGGVHAQVPFATPEGAADALLLAIDQRDTAATARLLGKDWRNLLPVEGIDEQDRQAFLDKAREARRVVVDNGRGELQVGADGWPLPIPLQQGKDGQWRFDPSGGRQALQARVIGANELSTMQAALAYLDAQRDYAQADRNGDGVLEYAQKLLSSPGRRDGLIWDAALGDDSPLGTAYVPARPGGAYHGYRFRILTGQGKHAAGGERSYLIGKRLQTGYGLLAWPATYGQSGVMSFMVNQDGRLVERDLGPDTEQAAAAIKRYDPSPDWAPATP